MMVREHPVDVARGSGGVCVVTVPNAAGEQAIVHLDENGNPRS